MPGLTLAELQAYLGGTLRGNGAVLIDAAASLATAGDRQLGFILNAKHLELARNSRAAALIVPESLSEPLPQPCLAVANPHVAFARAIALLHPQDQTIPGIHPAAIVAADSQIDPTTEIGPGCVIEPGARIDARCVIGPNCVVGKDARIGAETRLVAQVSVQHGCVIGERCLLHPGAVIGADGFGLAWEADADGGHWVKVPQIGRVILGDDVEVGANTCIDRGALDDTVIGNGVKLDNLIQIGHNCVIGAHTAVAACAAIAGSTTIGTRCRIGGATMFAGHLSVGDNTTISGGTLIAKSIHKPGTYTSVQPFMAHEDWKKNIAHLRHLDTLAQRVKELEKQIAALTAPESEQS